MIQSIGDWLAIAAIASTTSRILATIFAVSGLGQNKGKGRAKGGDALRGVTICDLWLNPEAQTWRRSARRDPALGPCDVLSRFFYRLLVWHVAPPTIYLALLIGFWREIDYWERLCGTVIAVREAAALIAVVLLLATQPSAMLVDMRASWCEEIGGTYLPLEVSWSASEAAMQATLSSLGVLGGKTGVMLYALAPEKLGTMWLIAMSPRLQGLVRWDEFISTAVLVDAFALGGLVAANHVHSALPLPLRVTWIITTLSGMLVLALIGSHQGAGCQGALGALTVFLLACAAILQLVGVVLPSQPDMLFARIAGGLSVIVAICTVTCLYWCRAQVLCGRLSVQTLTRGLLRATCIATVLLFATSLIDLAAVPDTQDVYRCAGLWTSRWLC